MADNFTVGTHGARIADSQPRGLIWGRAFTAAVAASPPLRPTIFSGAQTSAENPRGRVWGYNSVSVAVQNPPPRGIIFASPQEFRVGYAKIYGQVPPSGGSPIPTSHFIVGAHERAVADLHSRATTYRFLHQLAAPPTTEYFLGQWSRLEQDSTEQPFARTWRVAVITSIAPTSPPNRPTLFVAPQQYDVQPFARTFRVSVLPDAAGVPNRPLLARPQYADLQPFARLFRTAFIPSAQTPQIRTVFIVPQLEEQRPSRIWGKMPLDNEIGPVPGTLHCRAYRRGYFAGRIVEVGEAITISNPIQYSPYWMEVLEALPFNWDTVMRHYVQAVDINVVRSMTAPEAVTWVETGEEPPPDPPSGVFD